MVHTHAHTNRCTCIYKRLKVEKGDHNRAILGDEEGWKPGKRIHRQEKRRMSRGLEGQDWGSRGGRGCGEG